jgi:uncharacterized protein YcfJ
MNLSERMTTCMLLLLTSVPAHAVEFQDYAPVLNVEPVMETHYEPYTEHVCTGPDNRSRDFSVTATSIGSDVRQQARLWQAQQTCRTVRQQRVRQQVVAYRVTYRYGEETQTTRLSYDPGERMPVTVSLSPEP